MPARHSTHLMILTSLLFAAGPAIAQDASTDRNMADTPEAQTQNVSNQPSGDQVWRCSLDGKFYTVSNSIGLHIRAINSGQIIAEIPLKTDKKGRSKLEGQWGSGAYGGLIVIQGIDTGHLEGHMLVPAVGAPLSACNSRKAAIIYSLGQPQPVCNVMSVSWDIQPYVSAVQASQQETQQVIQTASLSQAQPSGFTDAAVSSTDSSLVGIWSNESATAVSYVKTRLTLRADGTYTKTFGARPPGMGGGVIGAPTWGDTHSGTWSAAGASRVQLSGDGRHAPYVQDLSSLNRQ